MESTNQPVVNETPVVEPVKNDPIIIPEAVPAGNHQTLHSFPDLLSAQIVSSILLCPVYFFGRSLLCLLDKTISQDNMPLYINI